jgi:DNA repair protein RecO (recombination protein O)
VQEPVFSTASGMVHCRGCAAGVTGGVLALDAASWAAMKHIVAAPAKKVFSFVIPEESERLLGRACESFVRQQLDKNFYSLDYWKSVK